jgi:hypothetical protein
MWNRDIFSMPSLHMLQYIPHTFETMIDRSGPVGPYHMISLTKMMRNREFCQKLIIGIPARRHQ